MNLVAHICVECERPIVSGVVCARWECLSKVRGRGLHNAIEHIKRQRDEARIDRDIALIERDKERELGDDISLARWTRLHRQLMNEKKGVTER